MRLLLVFALLLLGGAVALILAVQHQSYVIEKLNHLKCNLRDGQGPDSLPGLEALRRDFTTLGDQGTKNCHGLNAVKLADLQHTNIATAVF